MTLQKMYKKLKTALGLSLMGPADVKKDTYKYGAKVSLTLIT